MACFNDTVGTLLDTSARTDWSRCVRATTAHAARLRAELMLMHGEMPLGCEYELPCIND